MPIKTQNDLPVKEILERENIFVMDENRASHQNIRQLEIAIVNLMPLKEDTELQILRSLSNTPIQVNVTFVATSTHEATHTSLSHLNKFYETFDDIKDRYFDGMIITGAPVELMEYEEAVDWVVSFEEDTPQRLIAGILPDLLVKGGDYKPEQIAGSEEVWANGGEVLVLNFEDGCSTTNIIKKIQKDSDK